MSVRNYTGFVKRCQICNNPELTEILSLGHQPIVQHYLTKQELFSPESAYPLTLVQCGRCGLVQLNYIIEPSKVFPADYPYRTGMTNMLIKNFQELAETTARLGFLKKGDLIVDIGSNDGTLLQAFKEKGMRVLGVEPTNAAKVANARGIKTLQQFFSANSVKTILKKYGPARIITATNVFAHINDAASLVKNIKALMDDESVFISESQYLMDIIEKLEFDTIYHEHLRIYSLKPIRHLFEMYNLSLVDAERISAAGGSIRVYARKGKYPMSTRVKKLMAAEKKAGLHDEKTLMLFAQKTYRAKNDLLALLLKCKKSGGRIVGLTSSARSNTLLGFSHIDNTLLDYLCEKKGSPKIGLYTPGTHIPVVDEAVLFKEQPEYALVLSWHIGEELIKIMRSRGYKGKFILPLPVAKVVS
ncbi:MAG: class I SAM-dependent methyltransferase [Candidatus Sungbacteria bacterium]|uniref:Class I SAM-dependent methyltransferase n=1 Tax=Candidatus Sungiibacteriota bacterium TaxID=2750080 RepID=A0A931SAS4_9BACT|nr:class I SAM-dependent methyltransferase [Candidatus Sungbacteria bacterium]